MKTSDAFQELRAAAALLRSFDPGTLADDPERLAFWLNIYNVLAIHRVIAWRVREPVMETPTFFGVVPYRVGGHIFTPVTTGRSIV